MTDLRPCRGRHPEPAARPGQPFGPGVCPSCWWFANDARYRAMWSGEAAGEKPAVRSACHHLGRRVERSGCWFVALHVCDLGLGDVRPSDACQTCDKWEAR